MDLNALTSEIIGAAIEVHRELGPGLLESVYQRCMAMELTARGIRFESEKPIAVTYKGERVHDEGLRLDFLVEDVVVIELKSVSELRDVHCKQLLTYLRVTGHKVGLLINFNEALLKKGIKRIVNGLQKQSSSASANSAPLRERTHEY